MNIYCDSNKKLILTRESRDSNYWNTVVGDLSLKVSCNFKPLLNWESDRFIYFLKGKTWKGAKIENGIIVPSRDWSVTFVDGLPAYKGESWVKNPKVKNPKIQNGDMIINGEFTSRNKKEGTGIRHGIIISHTGTISIDIERIGHLSIEERKVINVEINRDGTFIES